MKIIETMGDAM